MEDFQTDSMPCSLCRESGHNRRTCRMKNAIQRYFTTECKNYANKCFYSGISYENKVLSTLCGLSYDGSPIHKTDKTGGATSNPDIQLIIGNVKVNIEVKNKGAFEGGGKTMKIVNGRLSCPNGTIHCDILANRVPWSGRIPSFMKGDKSLHTWNREKALFRDEYYRISSDMISAYYKTKHVNYIQVEDKGLYHTGHDILGLDVPLFECRARLRIRCKQHGSTSMPSSVQTVFTYDRRSLETSKYDIDNKLPSIFTHHLFI